MCAREFSTSSNFSKWIFCDFIFQIIFSSSYLTKKETADASSVSGGCCTKSLKYPINYFLIDINLTGAPLELCDGSRALFILNVRVNDKSTKISTKLAHNFGL